MSVQPEGETSLPRSSGQDQVATLLAQAKSGMSSVPPRFTIAVFIYSTSWFTSSDGILQVNPYSNLRETMGAFFGKVTSGDFRRSLCAQHCYSRASAGWFVAKFLIRACRCAYWISRFTKPDFRGLYWVHPVVCSFYLCKYRSG